MQRKNRKLWIIVIVLVFIAGMSGYWFSHNKTKQTSSTDAPAYSTENSSGGLEIEYIPDSD